MSKFEELSNLLLSLVPEIGPIGNRSLKALFDDLLAKGGKSVKPEQFEQLRLALVAGGRLVKGRGRGGSVSRAIFETNNDFALEEQKISKADALPAKKLKLPAKRSNTPHPRSGESAQIISYRHSDKRKNNPEVGMVTPATDPEEGKTRWSYDPHIDPALQFDSSRSLIEKLIDDALTSGNAEVMAAALVELKKLQSPYLNWSGKAERTSFDIDTVSLHVHERVDPASILSAVRKQLESVSDAIGTKKAIQPGLFDAPFENLPLRNAIDFYRHERGWANRLIAGDSLLVMNSLLQKEGMAGQVQMIYIDPPYGIKYGSNFQPFVGKLDVKDRNDADLTQEPEMIKAFRDTWELGIHSYLTYLRDRLLLARELLSESGSVFVQISDENVHHVREILDEIFGVDNFLGLIPFRKKLMPLGAKTLEQMSDFLIWYGRDKQKVKYKHLFRRSTPDPRGRWTGVSTDDLQLRRLTKEEKAALRDGAVPERIFGTVSQWAPSYSESNVFDFPFHGKIYRPTPGQCWVTSGEKMTRLKASRRLFVEGEFPRFVIFHNDFEYGKITAPWDDTAPGIFQASCRPSFS